MGATDHNGIPWGAEDFALNQIIWLVRMNSGAYWKIHAIEFSGLTMVYDSVGYEYFKYERLAVEFCMPESEWSTGQSEFGNRLFKSRVRPV